MEQKIQIYDRDNDRLVEVTSKMQKDAWQAHGRLVGAFIQAADALTEIKQRRLYLAMNFESFNDYVKSVDISRSLAYRYQRIGNKRLELNEVNVAPVQQQEALFAELGAVKSYELTRLATEEIARIFTGDTIVNEAGETLNIEDFKALNKSEVGKKVTSFITGEKQPEGDVIAIKRENAVLREELKNKETETKLYKKEIEAAKEIERKYGPVAATVAEKRQRLKAAREHFAEFMNNLDRAGIGADDGLELTHDFVNLGDAARVYVDRFYLANATIIEMVGDEVTSIE
jgi:hypothetical protein